jgi:VWFA-related protein
MFMRRIAVGLAAVSCAIALTAMYGSSGGFAGRVLAWNAQQSDAPQANQKDAKDAQAKAGGAQADQAAGPGVLRTESNLVNLDVVVTDKKGNYVHDLKIGDFKVFEDNKQQSVSNFLFGADPAAPESAHRHYTILFMDNSTMDFGDQSQARKAALQFVDASADKDHIMAVVEFGGSVTITQNFTWDATKLKTAINLPKGSSVHPNAAADTNTTTLSGAPVVPGAALAQSSEQYFGQRSMLLAIRSLAEDLRNIPGRKTLVLFTGGFPTTPENQSELTATIDACNKANVAVYPLDVRGLVAPTGLMRAPAVAPPSIYGSTGIMQPVAFRWRGGPQPPAFVPQHGGGGSGGGGGAGGGGGRGGGGTGGGGGAPGGGGGGKGGGGTGGSGGKGGGGTGGKGGGTPVSGGGGRAPVSQPYANPYYTNPNSIVPAFPPSASTNQQLMYELASGTGGFPILNTNDLLSGLNKINNEQSEYYLLGYPPADEKPGSCHTLKVKVDRPGTEVRARSGYCNVKPSDVLAGKPSEKALEAQTMPAVAPSQGGTMEAPFVYSAPETAQVHLAVDLPPGSIEFNKEKGKYHSDVNILGIAYRSDNTIAARFSDEVTMDLDKDSWKSFGEGTWKYKNQFTIAPGKYRFDIVFGTGQRFEKYEKQIQIEAWDGRKITLSGVVLSDTVHRVADMGVGLDADLLEGHAPLVVKDMEIVPSGSNKFKKADKVVCYAQIYEPKLKGENPPELKFAYRVIDDKGKTVLSTGLMDAKDLIVKGDPMIPLGLRVPFDDLQPGKYKIEMQAEEVGGSSSKIESTDFEID